MSLCDAAKERLEKAAKGKKKVAVAKWDGKAYRMDLGKDDPEYGTPVAGSKSALRGLKAEARVANEILDLVGVIYQMGQPFPGCIRAVLFGRLFQMYTRISDKVVGMLLRARRHKLVDFKGEMLYQKQDDDVIIKLVQMPQSVIDSLGIDESELVIDT